MCTAVTVVAEQDGNPFIMPPESAIFTLREKERLQAKEVSHSYILWTH